MTGILWAIHTLNGGNSICKVSFIVDSQVIFKDVNTFNKIIYEETCTYILVGLVIANASLPFVP